MQNSCIAAYSPVWRLKLRVDQKVHCYEGYRSSCNKTYFIKSYFIKSYLSNFWLHFYFSIITDVKAFTDIKQFDELQLNHKWKKGLYRIIMSFCFTICTGRGIRCRITMLFFGFDDEASKGCDSHGLSRLNPHRDDENVLLSLPTAVKVIDWHFS